MKTIIQQAVQGKFSLYRLFFSDAMLVLRRERTADFKKRFAAV